MKILLTEKSMYDRDREWLTQRGFEVFYCPDDGEFDGDPAQIDAVVCRWLFRCMPIEKFTSLKYIQLCMAGFEHMPMDYIREHGIEFCNARDVYSIPIAEFAIGGLLALYKQFRDFDREQHEHQWRQRGRLLELYGKNILVLGAGSIGAEFAKRFQAFGCHVTGMARTATPREYFDEMVTMAELDRCLSQADVVVLSLPSDENTFHIINRDTLAQMKQGAYLINICRGAVVDETALADALRSGHLGGAVLDVFEREPLPADSPLWDMDNVIVTPHTSFGAEHNQSRLSQILRRNLEQSRLLRGGQ